MRQINQTAILLIAFFLISCADSSSGEVSIKDDHVQKVERNNRDLLSPDGTLFPLSTYFGVCAKNFRVSRATFRSGFESPHYPTVVDVSAKAGDLKFSVGKFSMMPGTVFEDMPVERQPRRIQIAKLGDNETILVSNIDESSGIVVSIDYDEKAFDEVGRAEILGLANSIVLCHVSAM